MTLQPWGVGLGSSSPLLFLQLSPDTGTAHSLRAMRAASLFLLILPGKRHLGCWGARVGADRELASRSCPAAGTQFPKPQGLLPLGPQAGLATPPPHKVWRHLWAPPNPLQQQARPRHQGPRFSTYWLVLPGAAVQEWRPLKGGLKAWDLHSFGASSATVLTLERSLVIT